MAFVVRRNPAHMCDVVPTILGWVLSGILLEDLDNFATTAQPSADDEASIFPIYLSWPMLSPDPSLLEACDAEPLSHFSSSSAVMFTVLLKSLPCISMSSRHQGINRLNNILVTFDHVGGDKRSIGGVKVNNSLCIHKRDKQEKALVW